MVKRFGKGSRRKLPRRQPVAASKCTCPGPSRRDFLKVGVVSGLGLTLGDYFRMQDAAAAPSPKAQSIIYIFLAGGLSHIDSFDPKPNGPIEYRGELGTVKTSTGEYFGGKLPKLAGMAGDLAIVRSMTHGEAAHERGVHNMLTGYKPSPAVTYPSFGAVVSHEFGPRNDLPPYIAIPNVGAPEYGTGYLSSAYGPFSVGGEPHSKSFKVRDLNLPGGVTPERMDGRKSLLSAVDGHFAALESSDALSAMDTYYQRAYSLISSQNAREAFDVHAETDDMKGRYGDNAFGQRLLLARRLVEAGARFVTVQDGGWDNHNKIKDALSSKLPYVDLGISTLLADLKDRGLLESTMVVLATEFGRTVKVNDDGGRDHWPKAFSVLMAGGGIRGGLIHGETDERGSEPVKDPVSPADFAATMYAQLGIDPEKKLMSAGDRPIDLVRHGSVVSQLV